MYNIYIAMVNVQRSEYLTIYVLAYSEYLVVVDFRSGIGLCSNVKGPILAKIVHFT